MEKLTPKEKYELRKLYELNPDFYHRSQADKRKYGEERLKRMNQELMRQIEREAKERIEKERISEDEMRKIIEEEGKPIIKGHHSVYIEKNPIKND